MPDNKKFDVKDILLIVLSCILIVAIIALCVFINTSAILQKQFSSSDVKSSEACIASDSLEKELAVNYAMPSSSIVSYNFSEYFSDYGYIDYSHINTDEDVFFHRTYTLDDLFYYTHIEDDLPSYFQVTAIVYNLFISIYPSVDDVWSFYETSIMVTGAESNSIYSYSYYTYELLYSWYNQEPINIPTRNSVFSAGDSIRIDARVDDSFNFVEGMEFEVEYEIEVTRVYGYNLTEYIGEKENNAFRDGEQLGYETGYEDGYDVGYDAGVIHGEGIGYNDGFDDGSEQGYNAGYSDGYEEGVDSLDTLVQAEYNRGYDNGYDNGYRVGYAVGDNAGYTTGYEDGRYAGLSEASDFSFFGLVTAVFDAPLKVLIGEWQQNSDGEWQLVGGMLNFEIPGLDVNFAPLLTSLFTIALLVFLLRFILGVVM